MNWFRGIGAAVTTVVILAILAVWLVVVARYVNTPAQLDKSGKVVLDSFGNAKGILLAILPLATTAAGYWFGSQGTAQAQDAAQNAQAGAAKSATDAEALRAQLAAVLDQAPEGLLAKAKAAHHDAFAPPTPPPATEAEKPVRKGILHRHP